MIPLAGLGVASPAAADDSDPLYEQGLADMEAERYQTACPALRKSYRLEKRARTLFHLAECEDRAGRIATAALHYDEYLDLLERLSPAEKREEAEREGRAFKRREALDREIPRVTFRLPETAPVGTRVTRVAKEGGDPVPVTLGVPLPIDPGEHYVVTEPPGGPRWEKRFFVQKGDRQAIQLSVASPDDEAKTMRYSRPLEPVPALLPPLERGTSGQRIAAYVAGGIGAAGIVTGIITGAIAWSQKGVVEGNCRGGVCNLEGEDAADLADTTGAISTVSFPIGLIGVATAIVLVLTEPEPSRLGGVRRPAIGRAPAPVVGVGVGNNIAYAGARWVW